MKPNKLPLVQVLLFGILGALTMTLQVVMSGLPNIEPVTLLIMLFAVVFGWKSLYCVYVFVVLEILIYGVSTWNINYLYIWTVLAGVSILLRKMDSRLGWAVVAGAFGLLFGLLCAPVDVFIGGFAYAAARWVSGIPFDLTHCAGNFVLVFLLFPSLRKLLERLWASLPST